jgi:two-component system response regulator AtoC
MTDRILVVDQDESLRDSLMLALSAENSEVIAVASGGAALGMLESRPFELVLCELEAVGRDGQPLISQLVRRSTVVAMSADDALAQEATRLGAYSIVKKPLVNAELLLTLRQAREREHLRRGNRLLRRDVAHALGPRPIVAASSTMIELLETLERASDYESIVLLTGERGTGKEVLARALHSQSPRRKRNFVAVHCGASDPQQLAIELFGHARGAFPGADRDRLGVLFEADGGTLFLDDVGSLPPSLQASLLRVLQEEEVRPLGDSKPRSVDIRILAATSQRLEDEVEAGRFREDLFLRLNTLQLVAPPLRERRKDIPLLVDHFIGQLRRTLGSPVRGISDDALERLVSYDWPGNIRELENAIERAMLVARQERITLRDLPDGMVNRDQPAGGVHEDFGLKRARRICEAEVIRRALRSTDGNRTHAAKRLEISHRALLYKLKDYGIRD